MKTYLFILFFSLFLLPQATSAQSSRELTLGATAFTSYYHFYGFPFHFQSYSIGLMAKYGPHTVYVSPHVIAEQPLFFYYNMPRGFDLGYQYRFFQGKKAILPLLGIYLSHSRVGIDRSVNPFWRDGPLYIAPNPRNPRLGNTFNVTYLNLMGGLEFFARKKVSIAGTLGYARNVGKAFPRYIFFSQLQLNIDLRKMAF